MPFPTKKITAALLAAAALLPAASALADNFSNRRPPLQAEPVRRYDDRRYDDNRYDNRRALPREERDGGFYTNRPVYMQPARNRNTVRISSRQAARIAQQRIYRGRVVNTDLEYSRRSGSYYYEVDVRDRRGDEYEVRVDAVSGRILSVRRD